MLQAGSLLDDRYKMIDQIGRGGMSTIWRGVDERLNRQIVIKGIRKSGTKEDEIKKENLKMEFDILKNLSHPGLPTIFDGIDTDEMFLIVMSYVEGENLEHLVDKKGPQPQELVIEWGKQLCDILEYLHSRQPPIIHGDLKPSNIILRPDGRLVLIDFGAAFRYGSNKPFIMGTKIYAAPEQRAVIPQMDIRSDIYSLGALLYHLVTGQRSAPNGVSSIYQNNPALSGGMDSIIKECTQLDANKRFQSISEVRKALNRGRKIERVSFRMLFERLLHMCKKESTIVVESNVTDDMDMIYYNAELVMNLQSDVDGTEK